MAKNKPTSAGIDRLLDRLSHMKRRLDDVRAIGTIKDFDAWPRLKHLLEDVKDTHQRGIDAVVENGEHLEDRDRVRQIDQNKVSRDAFAWIVQLIEKPDDEAVKLADTIKGLEQDLAQARETIKNFGLTETV